MALTTCMPFRAKANFLAGVNLAANTYKMPLRQRSMLGGRARALMAMR